MPYKDPEKERARKRIWRAANREKKREEDRRYREKNRSKLRENAKRYREICPEKTRAATKRYRKTRRAAAAARTRRWQQKNPDKARALHALRRARKSGATIGDPKATAAREAEIRDSRWCVECKAEVDDLHVDHIQPLSKGGAHSVENLQGLCARHNLAKGAKQPPI